MDELQQIYSSDDAISGADVYKPLADWGVEKLNQPFKPLVDIQPKGFGYDAGDTPGMKAWDTLFPKQQGVSEREAICRDLAPAVKTRDASGMAGMSPAPYSTRPGLFGTTDEPCFSQQSRENLWQGAAGSVSDAADWINRGGAMSESSTNPAAAPDWREQASLNLGKRYEPQPLRRDYGVRPNQEFTIDRNYRAGLASDLSQLLSDPAYGEAGRNIAAELKERHVNSMRAVNGAELWNRLKNDFGVEQAGSIINRLGYFSGVRGNPTFSGNEVMRFSPSEAERALRKMELENSNAWSPENPAAAAHGLDFGQPAAVRGLGTRPTYEDFGYDYEPGPDPRQYGVPKNSRFELNRWYSPEMSEDLARITADPLYGEAGQRFAADARNLLSGQNKSAYGLGIYNRLAREFGHERAREIIEKLDYFTGIDGHDASGYGSVDDAGFALPPADGSPSLFR